VARRLVADPDPDCITTNQDRGPTHDVGPASLLAAWPIKEKENIGQAGDRKKEIGHNQR
jgi:hypothetical protein